ncbi:MAG: substrate-binding domain-containing protein, partial [Rhizobiales bacterium]|nr:substrate-binding domain-containing protein [Hyphomicrobiales bacterium]
SQASDLKRREADIAIRNFRPTEPDLIAKKIRDVPARLYATPQYLIKIGNPTTMDGLKNAEFINIDPSFLYMARLNEIGFKLDKQNFSILTENFLVMWEYVKIGLGIGIADARIGDAEPLVELVLPKMVAFEFPIWLVAHRELNNSARIRLVYDLLAAELSK